MGVFICWSGENSRSHRLAEILRDRIPEILQNAEPFISGVDIGPGEAWMSALTKALKENHFGILCITPENKANPWIHFEAGALWKADEGRRVCPLLYGIRPAEITGPLSQLQAKEFNESGFLALVKELNEHGCSAPIKEALLEKAFERVWPDIRDAVSSIEVPATAPKEQRDPNEMIEEILQIVRSLQRTRQEETAKYASDVLTAANEYLSHTAWPTVAALGARPEWVEQSPTLGRREHELRAKLISLAQSLDSGLSEALQNGSVRSFNDKLAIYDFPAAHKASFQALKTSQYREALGKSVLPLRVQVKCEDSLFKL